MYNLSLIRRETFLLFISVMINELKTWYVLEQIFWIRYIYTIFITENENHLVSQLSNYQKIKIKFIMYNFFLLGKGGSIFVLNN